MFCGQCGKNLHDDVRFCQSCGRPTALASTPASFTSATAAAAAPALSSSPAPGTASHQQLMKHYGEMSDQELMNAAGDVASLEDDARIVIAGELSRRKLSESDIIQYRQDVAALAAAPHEWGTVPAPTSSQKPSYTGALVLGWVYVAAGVVLVLAALATLTTSTDVTPAATASSTKPMGLAAAAFQGLLFLATGLAVLRRKKIAVKLVWTVTVLGAIGVVLRGLIPLDIALWVVNLGIARWFATKAPQLN